MTDGMEWTFILRLLVAGLLGTVIGLDREYRVKDAGFRTHFLVSLGSALIMIVSQWGFGEILREPGVGLDPSRIAAQVVSGLPPPVSGRPPVSVWPSAPECISLRLRRPC